MESVAVLRPVLCIGEATGTVGNVGQRLVVGRHVSTSGDGSATAIVLGEEDAHLLAIVKLRELYALPGTGHASEAIGTQAHRTALRYARLVEVAAASCNHCRCNGNQEQILFHIISFFYHELYFFSFNHELCELHELF